jgi:hypothetical protein
MEQRTITIIIQDFSLSKETQNFQNLHISQLLVINN